MRLKKKMLGIILCLVLVLGLMPGMGLTAYAAEPEIITVTWKNTDFIGQTHTKDGVTINDPGVVNNKGTEVEIGKYGANWTFTTSLGNFQKIEVNGGWTFNNANAFSGVGDGWNGRTWTGDSSSVSAYSLITDSNGSMPWTITFTIEPSVDVTGVSINNNTSTLTVGDTVSFTATVEPNDATDKYVTWSSNSEALKLYADSSCTVALGTTTGVAAGRPIYAKGISIGGATVTATSRSNNDVTASCYVTVISNTYNVTYKVINGTWSDGSTADKTETVVSGGNPASVPIGMKANSGYTGGSWDTNPSTATISADTTFTYTFVADSSSGGDSSDNTNTNTDTSAKVPYDDVPISTGSVKDITGTAAATAESNPFGTKIENNSNLNTLLSLTDAEVAQGVNVWLDVQDMSASVPQTDKNLIKDKSGDYTVGLYLDINLFKKVGSNDATKVSETNGKVKASIAIPESLRKSGRTFEIIRVHDGVATAIAGTYDENTHVFTFETDKFSTYALAYKDQASSSDSGTTSKSGSSNSSNSTQPTSPKTGDSNDVRVWYLLLIVSLGGLGFLELLKKED